MKNVLTVAAGVLIALFVWAHTGAVLLAVAALVVVCLILWFIALLAKGLAELPAAIQSEIEAIRQEHEERRAAIAADPALQRLQRHERRVILVVVIVCLALIAAISATTHFR